MWSTFINDRPLHDSVNTPNLCRQQCTSQRMCNTNFAENAETKTPAARRHWLIRPGFCSVLGAARKALEADACASAVMFVQLFCNQIFALLIAHSPAAEDVRCGWRSSFTSSAAACGQQILRVGNAAHSCNFRTKILLYTFKDTYYWEHSIRVMRICL